MSKDFTADEIFLERKEDETYQEYKIRLCLSKLDKKIETSWEGLVEILGLNCSADHLRKTAYGMKEVYEEYKKRTFKDKIVGKQLLKEMQREREKLDKATLAYERKKVEVSTLRNDPRRFIREDTRSNLFIEELIKSIEKSLPPIVDRPSKTLTSERSMVVSIGDIHYGKEINIMTPLGEEINIYNPEVFEKRMWRLLEDIRYISAKENVNKIYLFNLSDSIDGILRMSQLQSIRMGITDSIINFSRFMITWLEELSTYVDIEMFSSLGNHNEIRPLGSKSGDFPHENTERIITEIINTAFKKTEKIKIHEAKNMNYVEIEGYKILSTHGQNEKNLAQSIKDYSLIYGMDIDILLTGHLHSSHQEVIGATKEGNIEYIQVPSLCGVDDYAVKIKKNSKAGAKIIVLRRDKKLKLTYDIVLD